MTNHLHHQFHLHYHHPPKPPRIHPLSVSFQDKGQFSQLFVQAVRSTEVIGYDKNIPNEQGIAKVTYFATKMVSTMRYDTMHRDFENSYKTISPLACCCPILQSPYPGFPRHPRRRLPLL